jgi:hypothetical protein
VLLVDLDSDGVSVEQRKVATWKFTETTFSVADAADAARLRSWLDGLPSKDRTVLNLGLEGTISLSVAAEIDAVIEHFRPMFAAIERRESDSDLIVVPAETDFGELALSGFAAEAARELAQRAGNGERGSFGRRRRAAPAASARTGRGVKLHRISLRDYKGIRSVRIEPREQGVTIIEGDNEVGKSSIAEAIWLIFEQNDDSASQLVKSLKTRRPRRRHRDRSRGFDGAVPVHLSQAVSIAVLGPS